MYFIWILIAMASYLSDEDEYSIGIMTQESKEINVMDISSEEESEKTNFELLMENARQLSGSQISNFDDKIFGMVDDSTLSDGNKSEPSSPVFVPSSRPLNLSQIEVCH